MPLQAHRGFPLGCRSGLFLGHGSTVAAHFTVGRGPHTSGIFKGANRAGPRSTYGSPSTTGSSWMGNGGCCSTCPGSPCDAGRQRILGGSSSCGSGRVGGIAGFAARGCGHCCCWSCNGSRIRFLSRRRRCPFISTSTGANITIGGRRRPNTGLSNFVQSVHDGSTLRWRWDCK